LGKPPEDTKEGNFGVWLFFCSWLYRSVNLIVISNTKNIIFLLFMWCLC